MKAIPDADVFFSVIPKMASEQSVAIRVFVAHPFQPLPVDFRLEYFLSPLRGRLRY